MTQLPSLMHATLDPRGDELLRLHIVSPKSGSPKGTDSLLVINGEEVVPLGESWALLLATFLDVLKETANPGIELTELQIKEIQSKVAAAMHKAYPNVNKKLFVQDLQTILNQARMIARREDTPARYSFLSMVDYSRFMRAPLRMDLIVSPMQIGHQHACPLHCRNCYALQPAMYVDKVLTTDEWKRIIDRCWEVGIPQLTFTGGEPTVRRDLAELIAHSREFVTRLNTSGVTMTKDLARSLREADLDAMQMTLYSDNAEVHDKLVGRNGAWKRTVEGIEIAMEAGIPVSVNTPLVALNRNYAETLRFLDNIGIKYVGCSGLIPTGGAVEQIEGNEALSNQELFDTLQQAMEVAEALDMDVLFTSPGWLTEDQITALGLSQPICGAGFTNMAVMPNGAVSLCQSWLNDPEGIGNMLADPWEEIWEHPSCINLRKQELDQCPLKNL